MPATRLPDSELIVNPDGSVYHLGLRPGDVPPLIVTVGDPERVDAVARRFAAVEQTVQRREFRTVVGRFAGRRIACVSTGIGTDNVDIVLNELDALVNVDFATRIPRARPRRLTFVRLGTSGTFQPDIEVDALLVSAEAVGLDGLGPHYRFRENRLAADLTEGFPAYAKTAYAAAGTSQLVAAWEDAGAVRGATLTCAGFYGPQRRSVRLPFAGPTLPELAAFRSGGQRLTNFEMETAGIYGLADLLGHRAVSVSAILANRGLGTFSSSPGATVDRLLDQAFALFSAELAVWWDETSEG